MAGALVELPRATLADDFRCIDPRRARIVRRRGRAAVTARPSTKRSRRRSIAGSCAWGWRFSAASRWSASTPGVEIGGERIDAGVVLWTAAAAVPCRRLAGSRRRWRRSLRSRRAAPGRGRPQRSRTSGGLRRRRRCGPGAGRPAARPVSPRSRSRADGSLAGRSRRAPPGRTGPGRVLATSTRETWRSSDATTRFSASRPARLQVSSPGWPRSRPRRLARPVQRWPARVHPVAVVLLHFERGSRLITVAPASAPQPSSRPPAAGAPLRSTPQR